VTAQRHLYSEREVYALVTDQNGITLPEIFAAVTARMEGKTAIVELKSLLDVDCERDPERFRVTVDRIPAPVKLPTGRVTCSDCKKSVALRKDGAMWTHTTGAPEFPGSPFSKRCHKSGTHQFVAGGSR
jgi:hypothetical protein